MQVICVDEGIRNPLSIIEGEGVKEGSVYTVIGEEYGYSTFGKRYVDTYQLLEVNGLYEKYMFIPLSEIEEMQLVYKKKQFDAALKICLQTKPINKKSTTMQPITEFEALNNCLNSNNLNGYKIHEYQQDDKRKKTKLYFLTDDKGNSLTGHWDYERLNHFIMGYSKALDTKGNLMQQSLAFVKWVTGQLNPIYCYNRNGAWEIIRPSKEIQPKEFISDEALYNLFLTDTEKDKTAYYI